MTQLGDAVRKITASAIPNRSTYEMNIVSEGDPNDRMLIRIDVRITPEGGVPMFGLTRKEDQPESFTDYR
jgi:hypothetical protein